MVSNSSVPSSYNMAHYSHRSLEFRQNVIQERQNRLAYQWRRLHHKKFKKCKLYQFKTYGTLLDNSLFTI